MLNEEFKGKYHSCCNNRKDNNNFLCKLPESKLSNKSMNHIEGISQVNLGDTLHYWEGDTREIITENLDTFTDNR